MPRPAKTAAQRAADVKAAADALPAALAAAMAATGDADATRAAWDRVEVLGATIHRQSRILAGKSRGG